MPKTKQQSKIELSKEEKEENKRKMLQFAQESVNIKMNYTVKPRKITRTEVRNLLKDPYSNYLSLQQASQYLLSTNGNYLRLAKYFSNLLTYDYLLYPAIANEKINKKNFTKAFEDCALYLDKMNIKYNFKWFGERLVENGEIYLYKFEDSKGIIYKEIPTNLCRISQIENDVCFYEINIAGIRAEDVLEFPPEIQLYYQDYTESKKSKTTTNKTTSIKENGQKTDNSWYQVSNKGIAFNIINNSTPHGYPLLAFMFDDLMGYDDAKLTNEDITKVENMKLIHQKLPTDDEGNVLMDASDATMYHQATKNNLPNGVCITTNPLDMEAIVLSKSTTQQFDMLKTARDSIYSNVGVNENLFNGESTTGELLKRSIITDESFAYRILYLFGNYVNYELSKNVNGFYRFKVKMLETTQFNRDEKLKVSRENLAYGGSRMEFMALASYEPLQTINLMKMEQTLDIDSLLVAKQTAHTMNSTTDTSTNGRPTSDNVGDTGSASREQA